jgi:hypothetical protein
MSFNWAEYLSVAEDLCGMLVSGPAAGTEARRRAGVSRAYYASYVSARNRLRDVDRITIPRRGNPHDFVKKQFMNDLDAVRRQIGIELDRLRLARNKCDYQDVVQQLPKLARRSLARAAGILADLRRL